MAQRYGGKIVTNGLVLCLDAHDAKSYAGEPANNLNSDTNDYTGTSYSNLGEWTSSPTRLSKSYDSTIKTPIGTGATLIQESGTAGYHHLSRMGGSETGTHTISFYFKPIANDISDLRICMLGDGSIYIKFDFTQSTPTVSQGGAALSGKLAMLEALNDGWYFCAGDFNGRSGGWVGCVGYSPQSSYTGTSGNKKAYICGLNYNNLAYAVPSFDRSATDGWVDRSGNSNSGTLVNGTNTGVSHYRDGQVIMPVTNSYLEFDGSDDQITIANSSSYNNTSSKTVEMWVRAGTGVTGKFNVICTNRSSSDTDVNFAFYLDDRKVVRPWNPSGNDEMVLFYEIGNGSSTFDAFSKEKLGTTTGDDLWHCVVGVTDTASSKIFLYYDGEYVAEKSFSGTPNVPSANLRIGSGYGATDTTYPFSSKYGLFRIYNKALTAAEILSNYNTIKPRFGL